MITLSLEDKPKPTAALDYTFGRRNGSSSKAKSVAHIWELGKVLLVVFGKISQCCSGDEADS